MLLAPDALLDCVKEDAPALLLTISDVALLPLLLLLLVMEELAGALLLVWMTEVAAVLLPADEVLPGSDVEEPCANDVAGLEDAPLLLAPGHWQRPKVPAGVHTW